MVVPDNQKMRLILHLAKKEMCMDHKNAIGDLEKMEDLIETDKITDMTKRKTQ